MGFRKVLAVVVRGVVAVVAVAKPAFHRLRLHQPVLGGVAEQILEGESVRLPVAGEEGGEALAQQLAALLQDQLELLDAGRAVDVVKDVVRLPMPLDLPEGGLQRLDAAPQKGGVDAHDPPFPKPSALRLAAKALWVE